MKNLGIMILALLGLLAIITARLVLYPATQAVRIVEKTLDADNVIYNYEYFRQQFRSVLAIEDKINTAQAALAAFDASAGPRSEQDFRDKEERSRLVVNLTGLENVRNEMVAQYNARASMANRSIFMGRDIPQQLERQLANQVEQ